MINWFTRTKWLYFMILFVVAGCEQQRQPQEQKDITTPHIPAYIAQVVEKVGGQEAWTRTIKLKSKCVVTFYQRDGSFYLTEQHHEIYPLLNIINISAQETQDRFIWEYSPAGLKVIEGAKPSSFLPIDLKAEDFAEAILNISTVPVKLLENKEKLMRGSSPVKIEGRWYYPIGQVSDNTGSEPYLPKRIFYQNRDSSLVDMLWFAGHDRSTFLAVRGYYYHEVEKGGVVVPAKIEIFTTDVQRVMRNRLVKIDYH